MDSSPDFIVSGEELIALLQERLAAGQKVRYLPFRGVSMRPLLRQGKDAVELSPLPARLGKYDLPVYRYPSGKVVMHRVVDVCEDCYICLGDNTYEYEYIRSEQLIGLVSAIRRGDKYIPVTAPAYRLYSRIWVNIFPLRRSLRKLRCLLGKIKRKLGKFWRKP